MNQEQASQELVENLFIFFKAMRKSVECDTTEGEMTMPQAIVIRTLVKYGGSSVTELSQKVGLSHSTISGIVDRLEKKELVKRVQDPDDRRFTKVTVTEKVSDYLQNKMPHRMFMGVVEAFKKGTTQEQKKVLDGFTTLRKLMDRGE